MIQNAHAQWPRCSQQIAGQQPIRLARLRRPRRMTVRRDQPRGIGLQGPRHDAPQQRRNRVHRALRDQRILQQRMPSVQI